MQDLIDNDQDSLRTARKDLIDSLRFPIFMVALVWLIHIHQALFDWEPGDYGIISRHWIGLKGIFTGPLVHGSWEHLSSNTIPMLLLTFSALFFYRKVAMRAFWMIYLATGTCVWLFAREVSHIGASGVTYGLVAFLFWNGIFRRSIRSIMVALVVMLLYSGMFQGILPDQEGISWESHLIGSIVGIFTAFWFKGELEEEEKERPDPFADERGVPKQAFLPADIFEKTKAQRETEALAAELERQRQIEAENYQRWLEQVSVFRNQDHTG
jgi:membrane associated rhomboid family serine protease